MSTSKISWIRRGGLIWLAAGGMVAVLAIAGVSYAAGSGNHARHTPGTGGNKNLAAASADASPSLLPLPTACPSLVSSGNSCVMTDSPGSPVIMRACPRLPPAGDTTGDCLPVDSLADGTQVTMRCWIDTSAPPNADDPHTSPRWFYVNEVNGPHPGYSGFIYSVLVVQQTTVPACTGQIEAQYTDPKYQPSPQPHLEVVGACTTAGGTLTSVSSGFMPGAQFEISATYPDGSPYPLAYTTGTVHADGSVTWRWPCAGDPPGVYHTDIVDLGDGNDTGEVSFAIAPASPAALGGQPSPAQSSSAPPPPRTLDADATPAFGTCPSSPPPANEKYCGGWSNSCATPAFSQGNCPVFVSQGTIVRPVCWTTGQTIYNNYSAAAPGAAWTLRSSIWIKVSGYPADPWMNELWFNPDNTASNGLPPC